LESNALALKVALGLKPYSEIREGRFLVQWEMAGLGDGQLSQPYGITVNSTDEIYVVDRNNHHIQKFGITVSPVPSANGLSGSGISLSCSSAITTLNIICRAGGKTMTALKEIGKKGQLSNAIIDRPVINHGWISNVTITSDGTVSGGIATGYIKVEGSLENFEFRGAAINGRNDAGEIVAGRNSL
jgi:hypothetical protein